ncbi:MAG: molecular chaperone DnaJ [Cyanobacteria bacterium QH_9_48_43]|nr:MAG: molecular chaperone DnaJ [Cyanobacteria bacterium QH_9_48_43]
MPHHRNYYEVLQISTDATIEEIKQAFRNLARRYHPDLNPENPAAQEKFREIREAYEVLSDSHQRREYDQAFRNQQTTQPLSPQYFYVRGVEKALEKNYQDAIEDYARALKLDSNFIEAYIKRIEARYKLGNDRGVLEDCHQLLQLDPSSAHAYYYRGRARYRLGATSSALEAYTQVLRLEPDHPQAYYYRGIANHDLKERSQAVADLRAHAALCRQKGDRIGYQLARDTLARISGTRLSFGRDAVEKLSAGARDALKSFQTLIVNPVGGMLPAFARLDSQRAAVVGVIFAALANLSFVLGVYIGGEVGIFSLWKLILVGFVPFVSLAVIGAIARWLGRRRAHLAGDLFLAGASLLPIGFLALASGFSVNVSSALMLIFTVFASCYTILTLYGGCTQIANLPEATAAITVPVMLLVSGLLSYFAFTAMLM